MRVALALPLAAVLVAAAPPARSAPPPSPSFDCAKAGRADEKAVCATPDLAVLDRLVADGYAAALARAPAKADELRKSQRKWGAGRAGCFEASDGERPDAAAAVACLRREYGRRLSVLADVAPPLPAGMTARKRAWKGAKSKVEAEIEFPALAKGAPGAAAFDAYFEKRAGAFEDRARELAADPEVAEMAKESEMQTSLTVGFTIALASPRVVTVVFDGYQYATGAAHGLPFREAISFDLQAARPLAERDVFAPGGKERALALVARAFQGYEELEPEELAAAVKKAAGELGAWTFRREAVVVTLPVYSIGSYAEGEMPVWLTYDELRPMLRADAPVPVR